MAVAETARGDIIVGGHWPPICLDCLPDLVAELNTLPESSYDNNALTFKGWCNID